MRRKKVWRYYCDFCNKGGCSAASMSRHEESCCRNPDRVCRMCETAGIGGLTVPELVEALADGDLKALRAASDGCPACMLAAIIQSGIQKKDDPETFIDFNFAKERDAFWKDVNEERSHWGNHSH